MFSNLPNIDAIQLLWNKFKILYNMLHGEAIFFSDAVRFEEQVRKWVNNFTEIISNKTCYTVHEYFRKAWKFNNIHTRIRKTERPNNNRLCKKHK